MGTTEFATLVFLRDASGRVCLALKKDPIHKEGAELEQSKGKWNGYGGKMKTGETILQAAIRELWEESKVIAQQEDLELVAEMSFFWPGRLSPDPDMVVWIFFLSKFEGQPQKGKEMRTPTFFEHHEIPYSKMNLADGIFIPRLLQGEKLVWDVHFGKKNADGSVYYEDKGRAPAL